MTVPSVSWPTMGKPFSARSTCMVSVPYGTAPSASTLSQSDLPYCQGTLTS